MTLEQFEILTHLLALETVEAHLDADPAALAANKTLARTLEARLGAGALGVVATQIKYLQRARTKLPHYHAARCVIPPRAFEQAGSAETAAHKTYSGGLCIDLTCGLGVDSANFARHFDRVIALERDPVLARIAVENFRRLGIANVEVRNLSAEEFLAGEVPHADLLYADPDRRDDAGRRQVLLEHCTPDVVALRDRMAAVADRVVVKVSPLFDHAEAVRIFGPRVCVEAVSLGGECKEMLIETGLGVRGGLLKASIAGGESFEAACGGDPVVLESRPQAAPAAFSPPYRYLVVPDAALRKMRLVSAYFAGSEAFVPSGNGYVFTDEPPRGAMCRTFGIEQIFFDLKSLKTELARRGVKSLQVMQRDFPLSNAEITRRLGVREGGGAVAAFTALGDRHIAVLLR